MSHLRCFYMAASAVLFLGLTFGAAVHAQEGLDTEAVPENSGAGEAMRENIRQFIKQQLKAWEVPGCAVVAVRNGEVILNEGFGLRDVERELPVTTGTLFAIGSVTKAFTAAGVGAMVDDGLVEWNKPVRDFMSDFKLHDPVATERVTPRDLLSHRTGLPRHDLVALGHPGRSRADIVRRLRYLPLSKDIREDFQYCNLAYVAAGRLVEVVTGMSWEDYLSRRLLEPLGMERTNFSVSESQRSDDYSRPYERRQGKVVEVPFRTIDASGPAGSINSSADDMLQWLLVNLNGGRADECQVISADTIARMHRIHTPLTEDARFPESTHLGYGLGWMIGQYRGRRIVEHGGGIDGFISQCILLPQEGIGVVVLTNSTSGLMAPVVAYRLLDELLGLDPVDWFNKYKGLYDAAVAGGREAREARPRAEGADLPRPMSEYAGEYEHPGYGTISIGVEDGKLVPKFGDLRLALTHRHFDIFDLEWRELSEDMHIFPLTFLPAPEGDVMALTVPFESLLDPIRFERLPDGRAKDPAFLASLTGSYSMGPIEIVIALRGDRSLTIATPGNPASGLLPGRGLRFGIIGQPGRTVEFVLHPDGPVEKVLFQPVGIFTPNR